MLKEIVDTITDIRLAPVCVYVCACVCVCVCVADEYERERKRERERERELASCTIASPRKAHK